MKTRITRIVVNTLLILPAACLVSLQRAVAFDGRIVSGQNQNDGPEVAHLMMKVAGGTQL